ncbi:MAG: GNAT family N-acetyltransferase [Anaeroplasmataceae bacterium]
MDVLDIKGDLGDYEIILREINISGIGYIIIKSGNNDTVKEAVELMKKYNPKKIYITYRCDIKNDYKYAYSFYEYVYKYVLAKSYKEIKLIPVELSNREYLKDIINDGMKNIGGAKTLDNYDILEYVNKRNAYYFLYKKEYIGAAIINDNYIDSFVIKKKYRHLGLGSMCLSKVLYKIGKDTYLICASDNDIANSFYIKNGFIKNKVFSDWYEVE